MPVHINVGGVWKEADAVHINVGGVWKECDDAPINVGGVWKTGLLSTSILITLTNISVVDYGAGIRDVGCRLLRAGTIDKRDDDGYYNHAGTTNYISTADRTASIGDLYECKFVKVSGDNVTGLTNDTWYTISATREVSLSCSWLPKTYDGTLHVREIADTANEVTCDVHLEGGRTS